MWRVRQYLQENMAQLTEYVNRAFAEADFLRTLGDAIAHNSPLQETPSWYNDLLINGGLEVTNGKSIGSIVEKVVAAVIEVYIITEVDGIEPFRVRLNPAAGVDLPDIELGIKSPSENWGTSEPFFSPFERLTGNLHDCLVFLTNFQQVKDNRPYTLCMIESVYLTGSQLSDHVLTRHARRARTVIGINNDIYLEFCRFLCLMNKNRAQDQSILNLFIQHFQSAEDPDVENSAPSLHECELQLGLWIENNGGAFTQLMPSEIEMERLNDGPLNGVIGISFALQWRYTFRTTFN